MQFSKYFPHNTKADGGKLIGEAHREASSAQDMHRAGHSQVSKKCNEDSSSEMAGTWV